VRTHVVLHLLVLGTRELSEEKGEGMQKERECSVVHFSLEILENLEQRGRIRNGEAALNESLESGLGVPGKLFGVLVLRILRKRLHWGY
jgi:hypothetical protein